jgi:hypothetical protein
MVSEPEFFSLPLTLAIKNQFLGNREQRTLHLDAAFRTFV